MTDQKDTKDQPTEISDDDLDNAQGGATFGNQLFMRPLALPQGYSQFDSQSATEFPPQSSSSAGGGASI